MFLQWILKIILVEFWSILKSFKAAVFHEHDEGGSVILVRHCHTKDFTGKLLYWLWDILITIRAIKFRLWYMIFMRKTVVFVSQCQGWQNQLSVLCESYICFSGQVTFPVDLTVDKWQNLISKCLKSKKQLLYPKKSQPTSKLKT